MYMQCLNSKPVALQDYNQAMSDTSPSPAEFNEILAAEYNYIATTATQAHEDRARISSFYLIAVGSLVAALFGTQFLDSESSNRTINIMFSGLFILLTLLGTSTIMQLARLRAAWYESMMAMNHLKEFVIKQNAALANAFLWRRTTLPARYKPSSVAFYQAMEVALISGLMFGAGIFFAQQALFPSWSGFNLLQWIVALIAGAGMVFTQLQVYKRLLK